MNQELSIELYNIIRNAHKPREITMWHASSAAKCPRALYFERKQIAALPQNQPSAAKMLRWDGGHAIETAIRKYLLIKYPDLLTNIRFTNEKLQLTGEFDAYDPPSKTLISIKSIHEFAFIQRNGIKGLKEEVGIDDRGKKIYELKKGAYSSHEWQEHAYVLLMADEDTLVSHELLEDTLNTGWPVEKITYVYITLGGLIVTYTTDVKPEILSRVEKKVAYLNQCWLTGELPICTCHEGAEFYPEQNQYCIYKTASGCCSPALLRTKEADNV